MMLAQIVLFLALLPLFLCGILHQAVIYGNTQEIRRIVGMARSSYFRKVMEDQNNFRGTPLMLAITENRLEIARILVDGGANVNAVDWHKSTPMHRVTDCSDETAVISLVQFMLFKQANVDAIDDFGFTPLMKACQKGREHLAMFLLKNGANAHLEHKYPHARTALHYAVISGMKSVVDELLRMKAKIQDECWEDTPIQLAIKEGHVDIIYALLAAGAEVRMFDSSLLSPLHHATVLKNADLLKTFISKGIPVNFENSVMETPLQIAAMNGMKEAVRILVEAGGDFNRRNRYGESALHWAILHEHEDIFDILLSKGANLEIKNAEGATALIATVQNKMESFAKKLLDMGADPSSKDYGSNTPMHWAVYGNAPDLLDLLLRWGGDLSVTNFLKKSPLDEAITEMYAMVFSEDDSEAVRAMPLTAQGLVYTLIEAGAEVKNEHADDLRKNLSYYVPSEFHGSLDDFILKASASHVHLARREIEKMSLGRLIQLYETMKIFALYRVLKPMFVRIKGECSSDLESLKFDVYDELICETMKKTYMEKLPLELVSDALNRAGGYYKWKLERLAWNAALASRYLNVGMEEAKSVARKLSKNFK